MDEISIKISIGNRVYPLKIKKEDEDSVLKAAQLVNNRIKEYEQQFGGTDKYDHIAMTAMQFASEIIKSENDIPQERESVQKVIAEIDNRISDYLK